MSFLVLSVILLLIIMFISWKNMVRERKYVNLPGPVILPVVGNAFMFLGNPTDFFKVVEQISAASAEAAIIYIFSRRYICLQCPKFIESIVSKVEYNTKGVSYKYFRPWLGEGLLISSGYRWKSHRKFLTPAFHFNILQNFLPVFYKNTKILTDKLKHHADGQTTINVYPFVALAALDVVTESIMGVCVNAQNDSESEYVKAVEDQSNVIFTRMRNPFLWKELIFNMMPHKSRQDKNLKILHGQSMKVIEMRRKELESSNISLQQSSEIGIRNKYAFLDLLLLSEIDGQRIDVVKIREEVDTFMLEGYDTTASALAFSLFCFSKNRDVQEKILEEQKDILGTEDRDPSLNELRQMKYLEAAIKESLRLYPSVPLIERHITQDSEVGDVRLPRDTSIVIDIYHMQRREEVYESPLEFRPERFLNQEVKNPFSWLAFSAGPRNCIGQKFAMVEMKAILAGLVKEFHILPSGQDPKLMTELVLKSHNGVNIKLAPRNQY